MAEVTGLTEARTRLGGVLQESLGKGFSVFPSPQTLNTITKPTLLLERSRVVRASVGLYSNTFTLYVICPQAMTAKSEDALDVAFEQVAAALDLNRVNWDSAVRSVWTDTNPSYEITLTTNSTRKS